MSETLDHPSGLGRSKNHAQPLPEGSVSAWVSPPRAIVRTAGELVGNLVDNLWHHDQNPLRRLSCTAVQSLLDARTPWEDQPSKTNPNVTNGGAIVGMSPEEQQIIYPAADPLDCDPQIVE